MKLLINSAKLEEEFKRLMLKYKQYYWVTAWAGVGSVLFNNLKLKNNRIKKLVVGIHFYQTHPNFIETFRTSKKVKFIMQPSGIFHPKLYLFYNNDENWEIIVGSANFTNPAFTTNTEASLLISSMDDNSESILKLALKLVNKSWIDAKYISISDLSHYRLAWKNLRPKLNNISGKYGGSNGKNKAIHDVPVINMTWSTFISKIKDEGTDTPNDRLKVITKCRELFEKNNHFNQMTEDERKFIAGIPNKLKVGKNTDWGFFGSMNGAGYFKHEIIKNNINISKALDQIPLKGQITKINYDSYIDHFKKALSGNNLGTSSRLIAMKRPDIFICFDSRNKSNLCKDFGIIQSEMNYERYWSDIIERIFDSEWWINHNPKNDFEKLISESRAAFLDALYYEY